MPKDVIITPASGKLDFYATTGGSVLANINLTDNNDLSLSTTSGNLIIGDASRDVYIGDGTNEVDIVFEQNGEIRSVAGKYITVNAGTVNATGVAVNTSSPTAVMHVYGSTPSGTVFNVEGTNGSLFSVVDNLDGTLMSVNNNAGLPVLEVFSDDSIVGGRFGQNDWVVTSGGNVGIGTSAPSAKLHVVGDARIGDGQYIDVNNGNVFIKNPGGSLVADFEESSLLGDGGIKSIEFGSRSLVDSSGTSTLYWNTPSRIGILNNAPSYTLDVNGSGNFVSGLYVNNIPVSVSGHTHTSSDVTDFSSSVSGLLPTIVNSGNNRILTSTGSSVGINAESNLTFDGSFLKVVAHSSEFGQGNMGYVSISDDSIGGELGIVAAIPGVLERCIAYYWNDGSYRYGGYYGSEFLVMSSGGNIGIGTNNPLYKLHVVGSGFVDGQLNVDNLRLDGNTLSSTSGILIDPGSGSLIVSSGPTDVIITNGGNIETQGTVTAETINVNNLRLDGNTLSTTNTNGDLIINPSGDGALQRDSGGNARGLYAVDWQTVRSTDTMVANGNYSVIGGGRNNTATGSLSTIGGGCCNTASACTSTVSGGLRNCASSFYSTVSGGLQNCACANYSTVSGGIRNTASGQGSTVGGGGGGVFGGQTASGGYSTISGGRSNTASGGYSTISGGYSNCASGCGSTVGGGGGFLGSNTASGNYSTVSGGICNTALGCCSTVSGGYRNCASGCLSTVSGGRCNTASGNYSSIFGGCGNHTCGYANTHILGSNICATQADTTYTNNSHVCCSLTIGSFNHTNLSVASSFADADLLMAVLDPAGTPSTKMLQGSVLRSSLLSQAATLQFRQGTDVERLAITPANGEPIWTTDCKKLYIGDGSTCGGIFMSPSMHTNGTLTGSIKPAFGGNTASGTYSTVSGGRCNTASGNFSTVGGGGGGSFGGNTASGYTSTVSGGSRNCAAGNFSTVGGGCNNSASVCSSTVGGGITNTASGKLSTVGGGYRNTASGNYSTVSGGYCSFAAGSYSTVGGGQCNCASATNSTVSGGYSNITNARFSTINGGHRNVIQSPTNECCSVGVTIGGGIGHNSSGGTLNSTTGDLTGTITCCNAGAFSTIGGGLRNIATAGCSTISGGRSNTASGTYSTVSGGLEGKTSKHGEVAHASGRFAQNGDAQHSVLIARRNTANDTVTTLFLDGVDDRLTLPAETTWTFTINLSAYNDTDNTAAWWIIRGGIRRNAANLTALIGSLIEERDSEGTMSGTSVAVTADDTNEALNINVTGLASKNIRWVAVVDISQVSWGTP